MRSFGRITILCLVAALLAASAHADVPRLISYQGKLTDASDNPINGTVDLDVRFSNAPVLGLLLWSELHNDVPVDNGLFTIVIGSQTPGGVPNSALDTSTPYFSVSVNGQPEVTPRVRIGMAPFAARAVGAEDLVRPGTFTPVMSTRADGNVDIPSARLAFGPAGTPLISAGADNVIDKRMWIAHSQVYQDWGIQYRDIASDGFPGDAIEFVAGNRTRPTFTYQLFSGILGLHDTDGNATVQITKGGQVNATGQLAFYNSIGGSLWGSLASNASGGAVLRTWDEAGVPTMTAGSSASSGGFFSLSLSDTSSLGVSLDGDDGNSGNLLISRRAGSGGFTNVDIDADSGDGGALVALRDGTRTTISLDANGGEGGGGVSMYNSAGGYTIELDADEGDDGVIRLYDAGGTTGIRLHSDGAYSGGEISVLDSTGVETVEILGSEGTNNGGQVSIRNAAGTSTITLDGEFGTGGPGRITTQVLEITGGSDLSEQFDIASSNHELQPGMVVSIDPANPGRLLVSTRAYDRTVAGIVSGAGGVRTGMLMGQSGTAADGKHPVALTGRVYCLCDAAGAAIQPGDLLTTAYIPGHAMKVTDHTRAQGAIIGKAMTSLESGTGLVLVLVSLQ